MSFFGCMMVVPKQEYRFENGFRGNVADGVAESATAGKRTGSSVGLVPREGRLGHSGILRVDRLLCTAGDVR